MKEITVITIEALSFTLQVAVAETTRMCMEQGAMHGQPEWLYAVSAVNHLMLMFISPLNFIIYCAVGSRQGSERLLSCHFL